MPDPVSASPKLEVTPPPEVESVVGGSSLPDPSLLEALQSMLSQMESRIMAQVQIQVDRTVQSTLAQANDVLHQIRVEAATHTELRAQQLAQRQDQILAEASTVISEERFRSSLAESAAVEAARAAQSAAMAAGTVASKIPPISAGESMEPLGPAVAELNRILRDPFFRGRQNLPVVPPGAPVFDGTDPESEGVDATQLTRYMEAYRSLGGADLNISDGMLILMTASRFRRGGRAWDWWQTILLQSETDGFPFSDWTSFKRIFLERMRQPDESITLRLRLKRLRLEKWSDFKEYCAKVESLVLRLRNLGSPLPVLDQVLAFAHGLSNFHKLYNACPVSAKSLEDAITRVTDKYHQEELRKDLRQNYDSKSTDRRARKINAVYTDDDEADEDLEAEESESEDLNAVHTKPVGHRGRGRGRGGSGRGSGQRAGAGAGRGGEAGRRGGQSRGHRLTPQQYERFYKGECIECGDTGHFVADCPKRQENP